MATPGRIKSTVEGMSGTGAGQLVKRDSSGNIPGTGNKAILIAAVAPGTDTEVGDGKAYTPPLPSALDGLSLQSIKISTATATGSSGNLDVMVHNLTDTVDMLTSAARLAFGATTGSTNGVVKSDGSEVVATDDILRIDIDAIATVAHAGLNVVLEFA